MPIPAGGIPASHTLHPGRGDAPEGIREINRARAKHTNDKISEKELITMKHLNLKKIIAILAIIAVTTITGLFASPTRLPDGTTGAKVGMTGATKLVSAVADESYGVVTAARTSPNAENLFSPLDLTTPKAKANPTVYCYLPAETKIDGIVGKKIPAGCLVDFYYKDGADKEKDGKFICQYDTRGETQPFVIPCVPGDDPANPKPRKAPAPVRTQFADVQPGAWYYDAVTAVAKGRLVCTILDRDPNGNFKPDAILTSYEWGAIKDRLNGYDKEWDREHRNNAFDYHTCTKPGGSKAGCYLCRSLDLSAPDYVGPGMKRVDLIENIGFHAMGGNLWTLKPSAYMKQNAETIARQKAAVSPYLDIWLDKAAKGETPCGLSPQNGYANNYETLHESRYRGLESGVLVPETLNSWTDFVKPVTRAELCVMLYRAGTTEFGSWTEESSIARMNAINP